MKALVTGAAGYIGGHLVAALKQQRCDTVAARLGVTLPRVLRDTKPDVVFHLAGVTAAARAADYYLANVVLTARLLDMLAALAQVPLVVLIGSAAEYGPVPAANLPVSEAQPCCPVTDYAVSKYAQTLMGLARAQSGMPVIVARLWNPIGPGLPARFALASFARQITEFPPSGGVLHVGNLDVERDFLDVREAARLIVGLAGNADAVGKVINVCSGRAYHLRPLVMAMAAKAGRSVDLVVDRQRMRAGEAAVLYGDASRLTQLGLHPAPPDFDILLADLLADVQSHRTSPRSNAS